jgi:hypothetical protein
LNRVDKAKTLIALNNDKETWYIKVSKELEGYAKKNPGQYREHK